MSSKTEAYPYFKGKGYSDVNYENRFRFQNIMANRLNTRRVIRELVIPEFQKIHDEIIAVRQQLEKIQQNIQGSRISQDEILG
jgi:hypothetical protein